MLDWSQCPGVESVPGKVSGAWVFTDTRLPVHILFEVLASGHTVEEFIEWYDGPDVTEVQRVFEHIAQALRAETLHAHSV